MSKGIQTGALIVMLLLGRTNGAASALTEGQKRLIFIRVDFSDLPGVPFTDLTGTNLVANLNTFYTEMSYGRASFTLAGAGSEITPTFRMPQRGDYYGTNNFYTQLRTDARSAASAAGYVLTNYDFDVICFGPVTGWGWSGLGNVGTAGAWLRNSFNIGATAHELGHNFGLNHANFWDTAGQSVIGPGTSLEQGDYFDTMGWALAGNNHFNARYKSYLNWLRSNEVQTVNVSGTYRIYAEDNVNSTGLRALMVPKPDGTNYWLEFRQKFSANLWLMNGALLHWGRNANQKTFVLDTTPGSADGQNDAALVIGRTFSDAQAGIHITPIGKGGTSPESLDVVVNQGTFPSNMPPTVTVNANSTNAAVGAALTFVATAGDVNGDPLAYYWDFGDGTFGTNGPTAAKSWSAAGDYNVRCVVSDMKGGLASDSVLVRVGSPTTYRISGSVSSGGKPLVNVRVYVSPTSMSYSDSDGSYNLVGLAAGSWNVSASLYGYSFSPSGLTNPVVLGPNATNVNFLAALAITNPPVITQQPLNQSVAVGQTARFSLSATGTGPLCYQWRFNGATLPLATNAILTLTNITSGQAGSYFEVVTNSAGAATSSIVTLSVYPTAAATLTLLISSNRQPTVNLTGVPGYQYAIQTSTNLLNWQLLRTNAAPFSFVDTNALSRRFYRALYLP